MTSNDIFVNKFLLNINTKDKFLVIYTFTKDESTLISNYNKLTVLSSGTSGDSSSVPVSSENELYFDSYGNVSVKVVNSTVILMNFVNPIPKDKKISYLSTNLISKNKRDKNFIFSPNLQWILYKDTSNIFCLMYNFIHTQLFRNYYIFNNNDAINIFRAYCNITQGQDQTCSCIPINSDICTNRILGTEIASSEKTKASFSGFETTCQYLEPGCLYYTSLDTSFLKDYYAANPKPQSLTVTVCSQTFSAGGNMNIPVADIQQKCSTVYSVGAAGKGSSTGSSGSDSTEITPSITIDRTNIHTPITVASTGSSNGNDNSLSDSSGFLPEQLVTYAGYSIGILIVIGLLIFLFSYLLKKSASKVKALRSK